MESVLDNPVWSALNTAQAGFALGTDRAKRYKPEVLPFVGFAPEAEALLVDPFITTGENFYIVGRLPRLPENWTLEFELPCAQLLAPEDLRALPPITEELITLREEDKEEMYRLITGVQPGYYHPDTRQLGNYYGLRKEGKLVAMAGERIRISGFSEISAVCTLPGYTGRGYAQQLMARVCNRQAAAGVRSFLHVSKANERALRLYEHLGFRHRRDISFWRIKKISG
jgi:ribosomal protein S18 acetylase RimI-like enzyme